MRVQEVTKDYAIVDGEKIYCDEPFDEVPAKADFEQWLHRIESLLEALCCLKATAEAVHAS